MATTTTTTTTTKAAATTMTTTTDDDGRRQTMMDDDDGGYGGKDGHHRMRKGIRHDNKTIHNNKIGKVITVKQNRMSEEVDAAMMYCREKNTFSTSVTPRLPRR